MVHSPLVGIPPLQVALEAHSYAVDAFGLLTAPAISGWLQEAAGRHADLLGVGVDALQARNLTWVLARQAVQVDAPVALWEEAVVETWPSGTDRLSALRDFVVRVRGEERIRAVTQWIVVDLSTRKPVRPAAVLPVELVEETPHVLDLPGGRIAVPEPPEIDRPFTTRYRDIDRNLHVTNASYVEWACEAIPEETWRSRRLRSFEAWFVAECRHGSTVRSRAGAVGDGAFAHTIVREGDGRELARLRTSWVPRAG
ncbi:MAG: acyl-ACP thioesterase domain-containing protein [Anaeromyxobacteraceae bacterium]